MDVVKPTNSEQTDFGLLAAALAHDSANPTVQALVALTERMRIGEDAALKVYEYLNMKNSPLTQNERRILDLVTPAYEAVRDESLSKDSEVALTNEAPEVRATP